MTDLTYGRSLVTIFDLLLFYDNDNYSNEEQVYYYVSYVE